MQNERCTELLFGKIKIELVDLYVDLLYVTAQF